MREDENIAKYVERVKAVASAIKASGGDITEETVISKVLITLLPIYAIRVSAIQERRCEANHNINLEAIVGRLTAFELHNFDNCVPASKSIESAFEANISLKEKGKKKKESQSDSEDESDQISDSDLEVIEALLARKYSRGKGKYRGKVPLICFSCEEIGHIAARCPNKKNKDEKKDQKWNRKKDFKSFKNKGKKTCFMAKDSEDSNNSENEIVYISIKDNSDSDEEDKLALISHVSKNHTWIIDSGYSHHMTCDKTKFEQFEDCDGGSVRFGNNEPHFIKGR